MMYVNCPKKTLKGKIAQSQGGLSKLIPIRSDGSQTGGWISWEKTLKRRVGK
jgi:hypothetical protein